MTEYYNVLIISVAAFLILTPYNTSGGIIQRSIDGYRLENNITDSNTSNPESDSNSEDVIEGYSSQALAYLSQAILNWIGPVIISLLSSKKSMMLGSIFFPIFLGAYIYPNNLGMIIAGLLGGVGSTITWTSHSCIISEISNEANVDRNFGLSYFFENITFLVGNLYVYLKWSGIEYISSEIRVTTFTVFTVMAALSTVVLSFLKMEINRPEKRSKKSPQGAPSDENKSKPDSKSALNKAVFTLRKSFYLFQTKNLLKASLIFATCGLNSTFTNMILPTMIGATKAFGQDSDRLIGLAGIAAGLGMSMGAGIWAPILKKTENWKRIKITRNSIIIFCCFLNLILYALVLLIFPDDSTIATTHKTTGLFFAPNFMCAAILSFFLGFCDCTIKINVYSYLGWYYKIYPAPAFAIRNSLRAITTSIFLVFAKTYLWQILLICAVFNILGAIGVYFLDNEKVYEDDELSE